MTLIIAAKNGYEVGVISDRLHKNIITNEEELKDKIFELPNDIWIGFSGIANLEYEITSFQNYILQNKDPSHAFHQYLKEDNPIFRNIIAKFNNNLDQNQNPNQSQLLVYFKNKFPQININKEIIPNIQNVEMSGIGLYSKIEQELKNQFKFEEYKKKGTQGLIDFLEKSYQFALDSPIGKEISREYDLHLMRHDSHSKI